MLRLFLSHHRHSRRLLSTSSSNSGGSGSSNSNISPWSRLSSEIVSNPTSKRAKRVAHRISSAGQFIQVLELELQDQSAGALGRSQRSLDTVYDSLMQYREKHVNEDKTAQRITEHNELRKLALQKRDDLVIHRQCCGFRLQNDELIIHNYPIPIKWSSTSTSNNNNSTCNSNSNRNRKQTPLTSSNYGQKQKTTLNRSKPPPSNYICNKCMTPGHWREHCAQFWGHKYGDN